MAGKKITTAGVLELTGKPVLRTMRDVQLFVERDCNAEGFTIKRDGTLVALRFLLDGTPYVVKEYSTDEFGGVA